MSPLPWASTSMCVGRLALSRWLVIAAAITVGLNRREGSPRMDQVSEPYPGRWTHHLVIGSVEEIDDELMDWVREAYDFAAGKR